MEWHGRDVDISSWKVIRDRGMIVKSLKTEIWVRPVEKPRIRVLIVGKGEITPLQRSLLQKLVGNVELEIQYHYVPISDVDVEYWISQRPNLVVFQYAITKPMLKFLKASIPTFAFMTKPVEDGSGDLFDGKVKTVGIAEYRLQVVKGKKVV